MAIDDLRRQGGGGGQKSPILRRHSLWTAPYGMYFLKIDEIFTVDLTLCSKCQIKGEDFVDFCGLLRKHEL